jgi:hypothetical protein
MWEKMWEVACERDGSAVRFWFQKTIPAQVSGALRANGLL